MTDRDQVLELLRETGNAHEVARRLGIHENTVYAIERKARQRCARCNKPSAFNKTMCADCLAWDSERMKALRRQRRTDGVCVTCGNSRMDGSAYCAAHRDMARQRNARHQAKKGVPSVSQKRQIILDRYGNAGTKVWERDGARCVICETAYGIRPVHLHHIDQNKRNNTIENLVCLCFECHQAVHDLLKSKNRKALYAWFKKTYSDKPIR